VLDNAFVLIDGGTIPPRDDSPCDFQSLGPPPSLWQARGAPSTAQEISVLDNAFVLIEGRPSVEMNFWEECRRGIIRSGCDVERN
jgi:hypothetical protein